MSRMLSKMNLISVVQQLPKEDIETIQGYVEMIEKENKELKIELSGYRQAILNNKEMLGLKEENDKLKKQLEQYQEEVCILDMRTDENIKLINQQKEFIKYLENEINKLKEQIKNYDIWHEVGTDINFLILKKQFYLEILQKYKEIIGVLDENIIK